MNKNSWGNLCLRVCTALTIGLNFDILHNLESFHFSSSFYNNIFLFLSIFYDWRLQFD